MMWIITFHWFRACNKFQYAIMCVVSAATQLLSPKCSARDY